MQRVSLKGETSDFSLSEGGNHLDQSVLWQQDVIKLLMSLNEITCDLVAGSFHLRATVLFPKKSPLKKSKWKTFVVQNGGGKRRREE